MTKMPAFGAVTEREITEVKVVVSRAPKLRSAAVVARTSSLAL